MKTPPALESNSLPDFPVDEITLAMLEESLDTCFDSVDENGEPAVLGGRFTLHNFLQFMSGYNPELTVPSGSTGMIFEYLNPQYCEGDVIRSLINEVRALREELGR